MMKTIRYIISAIVLAAGLIACQQEYSQPAALSDQNEVEVTFAVQFPELIPVDTKSPMGEGPTDLNLWLCLYGPGDGFVQNWIPAQVVSTTTDGGYITGGTYKVMLPLTDEQRTVHLYANAPTGEPIDYIDNVMEVMVSTNNDGAYWQQVVLPHIKKLDNGNVDPSSVRPLTDGVHLVRNFAKVVVRSEAEDFELKRWTLINVPTSGYVAPYTGNQQNRFPSGYLSVANYATGTALYTQLKDRDNYPGYMPPEAEIDQTFPGDPDTSPDKYALGGGSLYMYERPLPSKEQVQTAILAEIEFQPGHAVAGESTEPVSYWYKIEVLNNDGAYFPFLRDIVYRVKIEGIEEAGEATAEAAFNRSYFGNISASLETAGLNELSNGTSLIHVDLMDYTFLTGNQPVYLMNPAASEDSEPEPAVFYFIPNMASSVKYFESAPGICEITVEKVAVTGYEEAFVGEPVADSQGQIQITLAETDENSVKKSLIRVSGKDLASNKTIYREITVNLMSTQDFAHGSAVTAITNTPVTTGASNPVEITLHLPEGLGASVFPVQVRVEAENNTLSAVSPDLPVKTGVSVFDGTRNTFYFIYTINYADYCWLNSRTKKYEYNYDFPITFLTSKAGDNSSVIDIRDLAGDFNPMRLTLGTVTP